MRAKWLASKMRAEQDGYMKSFRTTLESLSVGRLLAVFFTVFFVVTVFAVVPCRAEEKWREGDRVTFATVERGAYENARILSIDHESVIVVHPKGVETVRRAELDEQYRSFLPEPPPPSQKNEPSEQLVAGGIVSDDPFLEEVQNPPEFVTELGGQLVLFRGHRFVIPVDLRPLYERTGEDWVRSNQRAYRTNGGVARLNVVIAVHKNAQLSMRIGNLLRQLRELEFKDQRHGVDRPDVKSIRATMYADPLLGDPSITYYTLIQDGSDVLQLEVNLMDFDSETDDRAMDVTAAFRTLYLIGN